jgi:hypothetical protein
LLAAFTNLRRESLPGQRHIGHILGIEDFSRRVSGFLSRQRDAV